MFEAAENVALDLNVWVFYLLMKELKSTKKQSIQYAVVNVKTGLSVSHT